MRIAFVTESWAPNVDGVVVRLENTVRELRAAGHEVLVVAPTTGESLEDVLEYRTNRISSRFVYGGQPWGLPDWGVRRILKDFCPDVVHVVNPVLMGAAAAWLARSRHVVVVSYHTDVVAYAGRYGLGWLARPLKSLMRRTYGRAAVRLATSEAGRAQLAELGIGDVALWPRGMDRELFRPDRDGSGMRVRLNPHPEEALVLYVGRLAAEKDCDRLLPLLASRPPVHLAFVGDGPDRHRLEKLFGREHATFTGVLRGAELAEAYAAADVLVFPSMTDTLGLVLLEARACGVPIVATDTAAARETLAGYPHRVLVDPAGKDALRQGVAQVSGSPRKVGQPTGNQLAGGEDWQQATEELLGIYAHARGLGRSAGAGHARRISRFATVGAANAGVDLAVFNLLLILGPSRSAAALVAYNTLAVLAAIANSYLWNSRWTFRDRTQNGQTPRWRQRLLFTVQGGVNLAVNDIVVWVLSVLFSWLGFSSAIAANGVKAVAMLTASGISYLFMHRYVFPRRRPAAEETAGHQSGAERRDGAEEYRRSA